MTSASLPHGVSAGVADKVTGRATILGDRYVRFFSVVLGGYALGSKGFAYLGYPPIFIGEFSLVAGVVVASLGKRPLAFLRSRLSWLLVAFMSFGALRTLPFLSQYGLMALRDAALWGYGLFAMVVASLVLNNPLRLNYLFDRYRRFIPAFLVGAPLLWPATLLFAGVLPKWPGTDVRLLYVKAADFLVHLGGIAAFSVAGLAGNTPIWVIGLLMFAVGITGFQSRGGLLAFLAAFTVAATSRPRARSAWNLVLMAGAVTAFLA